MRNGKAHTSKASKKGQQIVPTGYWIRSSVTDGGFQRKVHSDKKKHFSPLACKRSTPELVRIRRYNTTVLKNRYIRVYSSKSNEGNRRNIEQTSK